MKKTKTEDESENSKNQITNNADGFNIELSEEMAEGVYSNLCIITHSNSEFIIDFISIMPNTPKSKVKARIIVSPPNMKRIARAMHENIIKFEEINGAIQDLDPMEIPLNFGVPIAQA